MEALSGQGTCPERVVTRRGSATSAWVELSRRVTSRPNVHSRAARNEGLRQEMGGHAEKAPPQPAEPLHQSGNVTRAVYAEDLSGFRQCQAEYFGEPASGFTRGSALGWLGAYLVGGGKADAFGHVERCARR